MSKYNSMVDIAFEVEHDFDNLDDLTDTEKGKQLLLNALLKRYENLVVFNEDFGDVFGILDTIVCDMDN